MRRFVIRNYYTNKVIKSVRLNDKARYVSLAFCDEENPRTGRRQFVLRDYYTGEILQRVSYDFSESVAYDVEE